MPFPNETREGCIEDGELTEFWCFYSRRHDCFAPRRWWLIFSLLATYSSDVWYLQVAVEVLCPNSRYRTDCHRHPKFVLRALPTAMSTTELVTCGSQKPLQLPASAWSGSPDPVQMDRGRRLYATPSDLHLASFRHCCFGCLSAIEDKAMANSRCPNPSNTGVRPEGVVQLLRLPKFASRARREGVGVPTQGSSSLFIVGEKQIAI